MILNCKGRNKCIIDDNDLIYQILQKSGQNSDQDLGPSIEDEVVAIMTELLNQYKGFINQCRGDLKNELINLLGNFDDLVGEVRSLADLFREAREKSLTQLREDDYIDELCLFRGFIADNTWKNIFKLTQCKFLEKEIMFISWGLKFLLNSLIVETMSPQLLLILFLNNIPRDKYWEQIVNGHQNINEGINEIKDLILKSYNLSELRGEDEETLRIMRNNSFLTHGGFILFLSKIEEAKISEYLRKIQYEIINTINSDIKDVREQVKRRIKEIKSIVDEPES